jgi:hypothetical protein
MRKNKYNITKHLLMILCFLGVSSLVAQTTYIPPKCIKKSNGANCTVAVQGDANAASADIVWQKDGSVIVNTDVTFISGIRRHSSFSASDPIHEDQMLLVAPEDFHPPTKTIINDLGQEGSFTTQIVDDVDNENWVLYLNSLGIVNKDLTATGEAKIEMIRRDSFDSTNPNNNEQNNFMFYLDDSDNALKDLLYGAITSNNTAGFQRDNVAFDAYGYKKHFWNSQKYLPSTDFVRNWNKPKSVAWWKDVETIVIVAAVVISAGAFIAYALPELGLVYGGSSFFASADAATIRTITYGNSIYRTTRTFRAGEVLYQAAGAVVKRSSLLIGGSVLTSSYYIDNSYRTNNNLNSINPNNVKLKSATPVILPDKTVGTGAPESDQLIDGFDKRLKPHSVPCPSYLNAPSGKKCFYVNYEPVVVKLDAKETHIQSFTLPGSVRDIITPYQLFNEKAWFYTSAEELQDVLVKPLTSNLQEQQISQVFNNIESNVLQKYIYSGNGNVDLVFDTTETDQETSFYMYAHDYPNFTNEKIFPFELGDAGFDINTGKKMKLYKCNILGDMTDSAVTINLNSSSSTNPTYLTGDNIVVQEYAEATALLVNTPGSFNSNKPLTYVDENGNSVSQANKPITDVVVNGSVAILEEDLLDENTEFLASDEYALYVGKVGDATSGILANGMALLDSHQAPIPDFVFNKDYHLKSLEGLELYLKQNKHLPHVPSQQDYKDKGYYSVQQMLFGQLQNLEELYLHTFSQEDNLKSLQSKSKELNKKFQRMEAKLQQLENHK